MDTMQELIPLAKELLSHRSSRRMVKVYLVGSVVAALGVMLGVVETVCQPFTGHQPMDEELARLVWQEEQVLEVQRQSRSKVELEREEEDVVAEEEEVKVMKPSQEATAARRNSAVRLHAS